MRERHPAEFEPLAFYPCISRPETLPIEYDEAATALYLGKGDVNSAAALLKVVPARLKRVIRKSGRLQLLLSDLQPRREG
jgi:hypothetical protein